MLCSEGTVSFVNTNVFFVNLSQYNLNKAKSAAKYCHQLAAWVPDMFWNFYLLKSHSIANNSATTEAREKNKRTFGILKSFRNVFMHVWQNLKTIQF